MFKFIAACCAFIGGWSLASYFFKQSNQIAFNLGTFLIPWAALVGVAAAAIVLNLKE